MKLCSIDQYLSVGRSSRCYLLIWPPKTVNRQSLGQHSLRLTSRTAKFVQWLLEQRGAGLGVRLREHLGAEVREFLIHLVFLRA
jgi:hypothetical protein